MMSSLLLFVVLFQLPFCCYLHSTYYVLPKEEQRSGEIQCPSIDKYCHILSYYTAQPRLYFKSNTTIVFLPGNHILDKEVSIFNANNLIFTNRLWKSEKSGIVCITCSNYGGMSFWKSTLLKVHGIKFINCSNSRATLFFFEIEHLVISMITIANNTVGLGMETFDVQNLIMYSCNFTNNGGMSNSTSSKGGNIALLSYTADSISYNITNVRTDSGYGYYGGLYVLVVQSKNVSLIISDVMTTNNIAFGSGANMNIDIYESFILQIEITGITSTGGCSVRTRSIDHSVGAGLSLYLNGIKCFPHISKIIMSNSSFHYNFAQIGSGTNIVLQNISSCTIDIINTTFSFNGILPSNDKYTQLPASQAGGGLSINDWNTINSQVILTNNQFKGNVALRGGAVIYEGKCGVRVTIKNTDFNNNSGFIGAALAYFVTSLSQECSNSLQLINVSVRENHLIDSQIKFWYHKVHYQNLSYIGSAVSVFTNVFINFQVTNILVQNNHNVSGMTIYGCDVTFIGHRNKFINNNSPVIGGGLIVASSNSFIVNKGNHVLFANNTAVFHGGAIYAKENNIDETYVAALLYETHVSCTFRTNVKSSMKPLITFEGNKVYYRSGDDFYGGTLEFCQINNRHVLAREYHGLQCPIQTYWSMSKNRSISSTPIAVCLCNNDTNTYNCSIRQTTRTIYPGQYFSLSLITVGTCEGVSKGALITKINNGNITTTIDNQLTAETCKQFTYSAIPLFNNKSYSIVSIDVVQTKLVHWKPLNVYIQYIPCPSGFKLAPHSQCICNDALLQSSINVQCNINDVSTNYFKRSGPNWIAYYDQYNCTVAYTSCPFDYCNSSSLSFDITSPSSQCSFNRTGTLCGQCQSGYSLMLGSNKCSKCNNIHLSLIAVFFVAGLVLIFVLISFDLTVSSGKINGFIFYANVVKLNESIYFRDGNIPGLSQFISWFNLDLGIETCFYEGLDGYTKTWLQFVFPIYLWLLAIGIIIACRHSLKLSRLCGRNAVPVLATIILMSYTKLLRNITNVFMFTPITCQGEHHEQKRIQWSVDPTLSYFNNTKRIPLITFSIILLISSLVYTLLVFASQWFQHYSYKCCKKSSCDPTVRLKPFIDAYCGPYKDNCRYWTGLLLIIRIILTGIFSFTAGNLPQLNNAILIGGVILLMSLAWFLGGMYKIKQMNVLEIISYLNIGFLSLLTQFSTSSIIIGSSVGLSLLVLIAVVLVQIFHKRIGCFCLKTKRLQSGLLRNVENESPSESLEIPVMTREELIFDNTQNLK